MPNILAKTWNRFITTNLCVSADVMGSTHEFKFEDHNVTVRLPKAEHADRDERFDDVARLAAYREDPKVPLIYGVFKVDVEIAIPDKINIPEEALSKPPKQIAYFSEVQKRTANSVCQEYSELAQRAFQYWLEIIRWVSECAFIGQPKISDHKSGWSTYIIDVATDHRVWAESSGITIYHNPELTKEHWNKALGHLQNGDSIPMHLRFLHDAKASTKNGQYEKAIIELAMACEIYLRYSVFELIPESTPASMKTYIEEANINQYVGKFFKELVAISQAEKYKAIAKDISSLMSRRNSYMHMGVLNDADDKLCQRFTEMVEQLLKIDLSAKKVSPN